MRFARLCAVACLSIMASSGAPAEVLLYTLVPEMLAGRNRQPDIRSLFRDFHHLELTGPQLQKLVAAQ